MSTLSESEPGWIWDSSWYFFYTFGSLPALPRYSRFTLQTIQTQYHIVHILPRLLESEACAGLKKPPALCNEPYRSPILFALLSNELPASKQPSFQLKPPRGKQISPTPFSLSSSVSIFARVPIPLCRVRTMRANAVGLGFLYPSLAWNWTPRDWDKARGFFRRKQMRTKAASFWCW